MTFLITSVFSELEEECEAILWAHPSARRELCADSASIPVLESGGQGHSVDQP